MTITSLTNKLALTPPTFANVQGFVKSACQILVLPFLGIMLFLLLWNVAAKNIQTSLGEFPGPAAVYEQFGNLIDEHTAERIKADKFYERQEVRNAKRLAADPAYDAKIRDYTGKATFLDQILTSLITVTAGFVLAAIIAIPLGIAMGLSKNLNSAINPIIQIFKPVSPIV
ncbi:ABC transporter permease, partial [Psychromonas sp.]|nr:ABC transporter permease [Psychromonas sp.]